MFFDSLSFPSLRTLALIVHFVLTTALYWTRADSVQVTLSASATTNDFQYLESQYTGLLSVGLIALVFEMVSHLYTMESVTLVSAIKLLLDIVGSFFIAWIVLDGLAWDTYIYIFVFCV
jgi:hypothetical protein